MKLGRKILTFVLVAGLSLQSVGVYAGVASTSKVSEKTELTIKEATNNAIKNNTKLKSSLDKESLSDDDIEKAIDSVHDATTDYALTTAQVSLMSKELSRALNLKDIESQKQNVEYQITKYFNTILNAEKDVELYDQSLAISKKELAISKLKLELGMISQLDYDTAELNHTKIESLRQTKLSAIDSSYRELNKYMGADLDKKYALTLELEYKPVENISINSYAENFVKKSLSIEQAESAVKTAKFQLDNFTDIYNPLTGVITDAPVSYDQLLVNYNQAVRALEDAKTSIYDGVISAYSGLKDSEIAIKSNEIELEKAKKQLAVTEKMFELGQVTQLDVDKLKYDISNKEHTLLKSKNSYALSLEAFSNPNLLTSFSSSGASSLGGAGGDVDYSQYM